MIRAAIYLRYSSELQDCATIETQRSECEKKAAALGAVIVEEYKDEAKSGTSQDDRENFKLMLMAAKKKPRPFDLVIVRKCDRFARNHLEARLAEESLEKHGVKLISVFEDIDTTSPMGWMNRQFTHLINEWFSRNLATETKSGMETNCKKGFRNGGSPPFGFKNVKILDESSGKIRTKLEFSEKEAEIIRKIFSLYAASLGHGKIIAELTRLNMKPRKVANWHKSHLSQLLGNEVYNGTLVWKKTKTETVRNPGGVPKMIDDEIWGKVQSRMAANKRPEDRTNGVSSHPLSGLIFCQVCGGKFSTGQKTKNKWYLVCANHRGKRGCENNRSVEENALVDEVKKVLLEKVYTHARIAEYLEFLRMELIQDSGKQGKEYGILKNRISEVEIKIGKLVEELTLGEISRSAIGAGIEKLELEKEGLLTRLNDLKGKIDRGTSPKVTAVDIDEFVTLARWSIEHSDGEELRQSVRTSWSPSRNGYKKRPDKSQPRHF